MNAGGGALERVARLRRSMDLRTAHRVLAPWAKLLRAPGAAEEGPAMD